MVTKKGNKNTHVRCGEVGRRLRLEVKADVCLGVLESSMFQRKFQKQKRHEGRYQRNFTNGQWQQEVENDDKNERSTP